MRICPAVKAILMYRAMGCLRIVGRASKWMSSRRSVLVVTTIAVLMRSIAVRRHVEMYMSRASAGRRRSIEMASKVEWLCPTGTTMV